MLWRMVSGRGKIRYRSAAEVHDERSGSSVGSIGKMWMAGKRNSQLD